MTRQDREQRGRMLRGRTGRHESAEASAPRVADVSRATGPQDALQRLCMTLPLPPSVNRLYRTVHGRMLLSAAGRQYHDQAGWLAREAAAAVGWQHVDGARYSLDITLHFPDARRRDVSNTIKALEDAVSRALAFDDAAIDSIAIRRGPPDRALPRVEVMLCILSTIVSDADRN